MADREVHSPGFRADGHRKPAWDALARALASGGDERRAAGAPPLPPASPAASDGRR